MKKGFTLIELLAVIVILAIIAVITVPMISNVIEESKKHALEASIRGIVDATDYFAITNNGVYEFIFDKNNKGVTLNGESINYTGSVEAEGKLILDREGNISLCLMNDNYYVYKNYNSGIVVGNKEEDSCNIGYDVLTNKYIAFLESVGSTSNVYSKDEVDNLVSSVNNSVTTNTNEITNIKSNIETLQNSLNDYALKSELQETNTNLDNVSQIVNNNNNLIGNNDISTIGDGTITGAISSLNNKEMDFSGKYSLDFIIGDNSSVNNYYTNSIMLPNASDYTCTDIYAIAQNVGYPVMKPIIRDNSLSFSTESTGYAGKWVSITFNLVKKN